jgi:hypothetical protein
MTLANATLLRIKTIAALSLALLIPEALQAAPKNKKQKVEEVRTQTHVFIAKLNILASLVHIPTNTTVCTCTSELHDVLSNTNTFTRHEVTEVDRKSVSFDTHGLPFTYRMKLGSCCINPKIAERSGEVEIYVRDMQAIEKTTQRILALPNCPSQTTPFNASTSQALGNCSEELKDLALRLTVDAEYQEETAPILDDSW